MSAGTSVSGSPHASKKSSSQTDNEAQQDRECRSSAGGEKTITDRRRRITELGQAPHDVERVTGHTLVKKSGGFSQYTLD